MHSSNVHGLAVHGSAGQVAHASRSEALPSFTPMALALADLLPQGAPCLFWDVVQCQWLSGVVCQVDLQGTAEGPSTAHIPQGSTQIEVNMEHFQAESYWVEPAQRHLVIQLSQDALPIKRRRLDSLTQNAPLPVGAKCMYFHQRRQEWIQATAQRVTEVPLSVGARTVPAGAQLMACELHQVHWFRTWVHPIQAWRLRDGRAPAPPPPQPPSHSAPGASCRRRGHVRSESRSLRSCSAR